MVPQQPLSRKSKIFDSSPYTGEPWALPRRCGKVQFADLNRFWPRCKGLQRQAGFAAGDPAVVAFDIHQHDVRADAADAVPGDDEILPAAQ